MADNKKHIARIEQDIEFADGKVRTIKPLTIKALRKFVKIVEDLNALENASALDEDTVEKMVEAVAIVLEKVDPEVSKNKDLLEEAIDMDVFQKIMTVAMGGRVSDPNE